MTQSRNETSVGVLDARRRKIVVGITGASGAPYAKRVLEVLAERRQQSGDVEIAACLSQTAPEVWALECGETRGAKRSESRDGGVGGAAPDREDVREYLKSLDIPCFGLRDYRAAFASGSAGWHAMIVVPCSMGTVARIAHGISDNLLTRAADVMLKEKRTLVVVPRETPLSVVHLENLTALARAGATILPAMPSFYGKPETIRDALDTVVARVLDHAQVEHGLGKRWGSS